MMSEEGEESKKPRAWPLVPHILLADWLIEKINIKNVCGLDPIISIVLSGEMILSSVINC
jgi:hypothetical protein